MTRMDDLNGGPAETGSSNDEAERVIDHWVVSDRTSKMDRTGQPTRLLRRSRAFIVHSTHFNSLYFVQLFYTGQLGPVGIRYNGLYPLIKPL